MERIQHGKRGRERERENVSKRLLRAAIGNQTNGIDEPIERLQLNPMGTIYFSFAKTTKKNDPEETQQSELVIQIQANAQETLN